MEQIYFLELLVSKTIFDSKKAWVFLHNKNRIFLLFFRKKSYGLLIYMNIRLNQHDIKWTFSLLKNWGNKISIIMIKIELSFIND